MSWPCCEEAAQVDSNIHHPAYLCGSVDHLSAPYAIWTLQPLPALVCQIVEVCPSLCHNGIVIVSKLAQREHRDMAELASSGHKVACYKRRAWRLPPTILSKKSLTNELKDPLSLAFNAEYVCKISYCLQSVGLLSAHPNGTRIC